MRQLTRVLLVALIVILGGWIGFFALFGEDEAPVLRVIAVHGGVSRAGVDGAATPVEAGEALRAQDRVVVGADGEADLGLGEETRLHLDPSSTVRVLEADLAGVRVELEEGRVQARVKLQRGSLGLSSRGRAVIAQDADFTVGVDGATGDLSVQAERGAVEVLGMGKPASLQAGEQLWSVPGEDVVRAPIAAELLLSARWPDAATVGILPLEGRTEPRARVEVRVDGGPPQPLQADGEGRFALVLQLAPGPRRVGVRATNALGAVKEVEQVLEIRAGTSPPVQTEVLWGSP